MNANALKSLFRENKILLKNSDFFDNSISEQAATLILTRHDINATDKEFIINILKACGLDNQYQILTFSPQSFKNIVNNRPHIQQFFLSGVGFKDININMEHAAIDYVEIENKYIFTLPELPVLSGNSEMKNYLWQKILKPIYKK